MADSYYNPQFSSIASSPSAVTSSVASAAKPSTAASIASLVVPLLGAIFGSKKASPTAAATTTAQQNATALSSIPPELKDLLNIQTQNAKAAQPLYLNAINAQNALLPTWARGGSTGGATGLSSVMGGTGTMGSTQRPDSAYTSISGGMGDSVGKDAQPYGNETSAQTGGSSLYVPGDSLDPKLVLLLLSLLNPAAGGISKLVSRPSPDTNFTQQ